MHFLFDFISQVQPDLLLPGCCVLEAKVIRLDDAQLLTDLSERTKDTLVGTETCANKSRIPGSGTRVQLLCDSIELQ